MADPENPVEKEEPKVLSGDKPQDFQIRLKIVQAHQLAGSNISPFCRLSFAEMHRQTRVQVSTTSPEWDESIIINTKKTPDELNASSFVFEVVDQKGTFSSNVVIGTFSLAASQVYSEPKHCLLDRWLFLVDPNDGSTHTGYLRMSAAILGPGDEAPVFPAVSDSSVDDDDIEKSLLKPTKAVTIPAEIIFRLYRAEDLPQMDPSELMESMKKFFGSKPKEVDRVDPYVTFKFSGKTGKSAIKETCMSPKWNQQISWNIHLPCVSDRITVQLRDYDRLGDDETIGTFSIPLREAQFGMDGPPHFGPTWINFYGSPREYALTNPLKYLDEGKDEGVAFRGRAFLEFMVKQKQTEDSENSTNKPPQVTPISQEEITKANAFDRRRKFRLMAVIFDAGWLPSKEGPVEFEFSIGVNGDKFDRHAMPAASTTTPAMPRFDGSNYYYMPHLTTSPKKTCLNVEAPFEDAAYRLETINYFSNAATIIDEGLSNYDENSAMDADALKRASLRQIISKLRDFFENCKVPAAKETQQPTVMDQQLYKHRLNMVEDTMKELKRMEQTLSSGNNFAEIAKNLRMTMKTLEKLGTEVQNSIPDIFVWMIRDSKRIAYARMPAASIFLGRNPSYNGKQTGKLLTLELRNPNVDSSWGLPALIRARFWFFTDNRFDQWYRHWPKFSVGFYAHVYENQVKPKFSPIWTSAKSGDDKRPNYSDESGHLDLGDLKSVQPPQGWCWEDDEWSVSTDLITLYRSEMEDAAVKSTAEAIVEEFYECNKRDELSDWVDHDEMKYVNDHGEKIERPDDNAQPPAGWVWEKPAIWTVDMNRACDDEGWDYGETMEGPWEPCDKWYLHFRRRRWIRRRTVAVGSKPKSKDKPTLSPDGWVYASSFDSASISPTERSLDWTRWRLWRRKIMSIGGTVRGSIASGITPLQPMKPKQPPGCLAAKGNTVTGSILLPPKAVINLGESEVHTFQLRAYVFEARNLLSASSDGFSDPFVIVSSSSCSAQSKVIQKSTAPRLVAFKI